MRIVAGGIRAFATEKVEASRYSLRGWIVREVAGVACWTISSLQIVLANGDLDRIMDVRAKWAFRAVSCLKRTSVSVAQISLPNKETAGLHQH